MGCHRSGTNLLYDTLLSAGGFAVYRGYLPVYKVLIPRFGRLENLENRKRIIQIWLRSKGFRRSGLDRERLSEKLLRDCSNGGDFIRIHMEEIARNQNVGRWAVYDPDTVLHVPRIKAEIPEALFVHIVRDGRDIALSLKKMGGFKPFPWDRGPRSLRETALYWEWMVRKGREYGQRIPSDYFEIRYEDLIREPKQTLRRLGDFLEHDLDYDRIHSARMGRLSQSNSSFEEDEEAPSPIERWKQMLSREQVVALEAVVGDCLDEFGYSLTTGEQERKRGVRETWMRRFYPAVLDTKFWLKTKTPVGRLANLSVLELEDAVIEDSVNV